MSRLCVLVLLSVAVLAGCNGEIYGPGRTLSKAARITPRSQWTATGNLGDPSKAIDGNIGTITVVGDRRRPADLIIDLGRVCVFNMIAIDHGAREMGFCRRLGIATTTTKPNDFTLDSYIAVGTRRITTVVLQQAVLARYVRLCVIGQGENPWAVAEVYVQ